MENVQPQQTEAESPTNLVAPAVADEQEPASSPGVHPTNRSVNSSVQQPDGYFEFPLPEVDLFDEAYGSMYGAFVKDV